MRRAFQVASSGAAAVAALCLASCSQPASSPSGGSTVAAPAAKQLKIGFLGFAKANSFAEATWAGIQQYASSHNATATFLDSNFDAPTQVNQLQDAVTSKAYDVVIVQANDGTAMVNPVRQAVAAGITVVVEFTPVGGKYDTAAPQVPGTINIVDPPTLNGAGLAKLGLGACKTVASGNCTVAYFQGFANFPLDAARTQAVVSALKAGGATVVSNLVGGYTPDTGRTAMQNLLQAHPEVNVVIGSSQAMEGATPLAAGKKITFVGNGGSKQAFDYVNNSTWYGVYGLPEKAQGAKAAEFGLNKARGQTVPDASLSCQVLTKFSCLGTKQTLAGLTADYSD